MSNVLVRVYDVDDDDCDDLIGRKVLLAVPDKHYTIGVNNPLMGTEWECVGVISDIEDGLIQVDWDNGRFNSYKDGELIYVDAGRMESIW